ncbi:MAG: hypothetical protein LBJ00_04550 [Planctomycetaceae bacterium]|nr:hypothetical protein [Planctomycetaceae bacterium]
MSQIFICSFHESFNIASFNGTQDIFNAIFYQHFIPNGTYSLIIHRYTVAGRAIGFALEQPLHVVTLACSVKTA